MERQRLWFRTRSRTSGYWILPHTPTFSRPSDKVLMTQLTAGSALLVKYSKRCDESMGYAVKISRRAERDLDELFRYLDAANSRLARRWFNRLEKAIYSLDRFPRRCPRAPEARRLGRSLRHLLYSRKPDVYRVLYEIRESRKTVLVLAIQHSARDQWNPDNSKD